MRPSLDDPLAYEQASVRRITDIGRKRTNKESSAFKKKVLELRSGGQSINKIAHRLQVSKQYVSLVLIEAGQGGRKVNIKPAAEKPADNNEQIHAAATQVEGHGEFALAGLLRAVAERRKAATPPGRRPRKRDSS